MVSLLISWKGKRCSGTIFHIDASWISRASHDPLLFDPCISSVHWGAKLEPGDHKLWFCSPSYWQGDWMSSCQREGHEKKAFTCSVFHHQGDLRFCLINLHHAEERLRRLQNGWLASGIFFFFFDGSQVENEQNEKRSDYQCLSAVENSSFNSSDPCAPPHHFTREHHFPRMFCTDSIDWSVLQNWEPVNPWALPPNLEIQMEIVV